TKDRGHVDGDGYFYHAGRADDVIISAGWTMSAIEIEDVLLRHPDVREAAVIGVADALRGQVVKAFIVSARSGDDAFARELQDLARTRLSQHEYPRQVAFVAALPKTPAGKVNRKALREAEASAVEPTHAPWNGALSQDHGARARRLAPPDRCKDHRHARARVPRGHAGQHPPLCPRHRRRQPALVRSRVRGGHPVGHDPGAAELSLCH